MVEISKEELEKLEEIINNLEGHLRGTDYCDGLAIYWGDTFFQVDRLGRLFENIIKEFSKLYPWFDEQYNKDNTKSVGMKVELDDIIKDLETISICPHCGKIMDCYSHYCDNCKERVAIPDDGGWFAEYFRKKYKSRNGR